MEYIFQSLNRTHDVGSIPKCSFQNHLFRTTDKAVAEKLREVMSRNPHEIFEITPKTVQDEMRASARDTKAEASLKPERTRRGRPPLSAGVKMQSGMRTTNASTPSSEEDVEEKEGT